MQPNETDRVRTISTDDRKKLARCASCGSPIMFLVGDAKEDDVIVCLWCTAEKRMVRK
jgi:DNA-directed RNA polymerase subunit RPC12/RpoP